MVLRSVVRHLALSTPFQYASIPINGFPTACIIRTGMNRSSMYWMRTPAVSKGDIVSSARQRLVEAAQQSKIPVSVVNVMSLNLFSSPIILELSYSQFTSRLYLLRHCSSSSSSSSYFSLCRPTCEPRVKKTTQQSTSHCSCATISTCIQLFFYLT